MILRRLSQSLKEQDWIAIGIEFVLLVAGVFFGIQVANWNEERTDRVREATYLSGLAKDIRKDTVEMDEINRVSTQRMSALGYLLRNAGGRELPTGFDSARGRIEIEQAPPYVESNPNTIGLSIFILTTLDGNRIAFDTMINTGGFGVIRDGALVRAIQSYYANVDKVHHFENALQESRWRLVDAQQQAGLSPVDAMPAKEIAKAFSADNRLLAAARNYWLYTNRHMREIKALRRHADEIATRLEKDHHP